jgi:hypothetical protein
MGGTCNMSTENQKCVQNLDWKSECKRPLMTPRRRWEVNRTSCGLFYDDVSISYCIAPDGRVIGE